MTLEEEKESRSVPKTLARVTERWGGCYLRWEDRDSHGFGCEVQEFSFGRAKLEYFPGPQMIKQKGIFILFFFRDSHLRDSGLTDFGCYLGISICQSFPGESNVLCWVVGFFTARNMLLHS